MESHLRLQSQHIKTIKKIIGQITKDSTARKTVQYGEARLLDLKKAWEEIERLNVEIEAFREQVPEHKYFKENYYAQVEALYDQTREQLEDIIRDAIERKNSSENIAEQLRLIKKQGAIIETLQRNIASIERDISSKQSAAYVGQKIKILTDYWELIVQNHSEIVALGKFKDEYFEQNIFNQTEDVYQATIIKLQEHLENRTEPTTSRQNIPLRNQESENSSKVKLPRIDVPVFNGDYLKWQSFKNLFTELIHKNDTIAKAEKLFYLKTNVVGEPNELIRHLSITNENYDTAWNTLNRRYDNKRTLVSVHLRTLCSQTELTKESAGGLKKLHDTTTECLEAIKNLGIDITNWDPVIIYLIAQKLDKESRRVYEQSLKNPRELQTLKEFLEFLENRFQGLEAIEPVKQSSIFKKQNDLKVHHGIVGKQTCPICKSDHKIYSCEKFSKLNAAQRNEAIRKAKLCTNCLGKGHSADICKSWKACKICNKKHHTLLHLKSPNLANTSNQKIKVQEKSERESSEIKKQSTSEVSTHITESRMQRTVLLATATLQAIGKNDIVLTLRALIDQGAQASFITEEAAQRLKLPKKKIQAVVTGVGQSEIKNIHSCVELTIQPRFSSSFSTTTTALILKNLTKLMPSERIATRSWDHIKDLVLADPEYFEPRKIDIILGADIFGQILMDKVLRGPPGSPIAQKTKLGWILSGGVHNDSENKQIQCYISEVDLSKELRKFWEIEEVDNAPIMTSEDLMAEHHFRTTYRRNIDGRYIVRLPFKEDLEQADLGGSRELAIARLLQVERKFKTNRTFEIMYKDFMKEYLQLGHMVPATDNIGKNYYLPHHAVLKEDSTTTKLRVVLDGSAKRQNKKSLNDIMLVGPQVQQNLISILLRKKWFYVKSNENPADIASRGIFPSKLEENSLWWEGPHWLKSDKLIYNTGEVDDTDLEKKKEFLSNTMLKETLHPLERILQRYSSLKKIQRVLAYCQRFIRNIKEGVRDTRPLTLEELEDSLLSLVQYTQHQHFSEDLSKLRNGQELSKTSRLVSLAPFIDAKGIMRVGGRLENADITNDQKHPIIIPYQSNLTTLVIDEAHKKTLHGGNSLTLGNVRQEYWILNGLKAVKGHIHKCIRCHRHKAKMTQQMMGMLPKSRVTPGRPFTHTGVDYAGPIKLIAKGRGNRTHKGYLAIFICLTTKAIHIEVVTDLTSQAFIAAFKRLVSRRGPVAHIYSDNATNFIGASKLICDHQSNTHQDEITEVLKQDGTQWHFIPPSSPHFGGLWEAGVKSVKHHMKRVIGETKLTYEEMTTLMNQIEACLNSRPLCPLSEDPESLEVLTPGHFLTGAPILSLQDKDHLDTNPNLLKRWDRVTRMYQDFWKKWSVEYIGRLQNRSKWAQKQENLKEGNLVLIKDEQSPPSRWALGRVIATHPGADGLTRVVTLQTKNGKLKRPVTKLSLLPLISNEKESPTLTHLLLTDGLTEVLDSPSKEESNNSRKRSNDSNIEEHPKRYRTESSVNRASGMNNWAYLLLLSLFFAIALAAPDKPYEIRNLTNHEGIYFDDISEVSLYSSEWNLLIYYNLSTYWKEFYAIQSSINRLNKICKEEIRLSRETCQATVAQLNHQALEVEHSNEILYQQNEHLHIRNKRAPFEIVGTVFNKLFGILDQDSADHYEEQINKIAQNENYFRSLLKNQTSIVENTINVIKKNHDTVQLQLSRVEKQIETIFHKLNHSQYEILATEAFNSAAILVTLTLMSFQNIQSSILSVIMDTKHGQINTLLLTPAQLNDQLKIIREHLPHHLQLPGNGQTHSLMALYNSMHCKVRVTHTNVLFNIQIPLLNAESYHLYELIPVPTIYNGNFVYIEPTSKYLIVNNRRDRFSPLSEKELTACQRIIEDQLLCSLKRPIFTLRSNVSHCEMEMLNNQRRISPFCKLRNQEMETQWKKLHGTNTWLFSLKEEQHFDISCDNVIYPQLLRGNGILQLKENCVIKHQTLYINSNKLQSTLKTSFIPETRLISDHLNQSFTNSSWITIPQMIKNVNSDDLDELGKAIKNQRELVDNMPNLNIHDLHHYSSTYLILCGILATGLYLWCKGKHGVKFFAKAKPTPAPRTGLMEIGSHIELPTLNSEAGECTQHI